METNDRMCDKSLELFNEELTDKGKIYILYGKPDKTDSEFINNRQEEIWIYEKTKKKYYFTTIAAGLLKLSKIEDM